MENIGFVFSIEEFSTFDGPGIRTTVFLKGCPLKCSWCHNPEGQSFKQEILKSPNGCVHCERCTAVAQKLYGSSKLVEECIAVCPHGLIRKSGTEYTPQQLFDKIIRNERFYNSSDGGVTFSGGEPLAQPVFLLECLHLFEGKVNRCIQTSGYCDNDIFKKVLEKTDYMLFDLKVIDPSGSKRYTGADINVIINNFQTLAQSNVPFIVRIPLIPGVTDTEKNINDIADLLNQNGVHYAEVLPYNKFAGSKYALCDRDYTPDFDPEVQVCIPDKLFAKKDIQIKVL